MTGTCDCCGQEDTPLNFRIAYGIETYACNECCGIEDEDDGGLIIIGDIGPLLKGEE